jgi:hypothetical protein
MRHTRHTPGKPRAISADETPSRQTYDPWLLIPSLQAPRPHPCRLTNSTLHAYHVLPGGPLLPTVAVVTLTRQGPSDGGSAELLPTLVLHPGILAPRPGTLTDRRDHMYVHTHVSHRPRSPFACPLPSPCPLLSCVSVHHLLPLGPPTGIPRAHLMTTLLRSWSITSQPSRSNHLQNMVKVPKPHVLYVKRLRGGRPGSPRRRQTGGATVSCQDFQGRQNMTDATLKSNQSGECQFVLEPGL